MVRRCLTFEKENCIDPGGKQVHKKAVIDALLSSQDKLSVDNLKTIAASKVQTFPCEDVVNYFCSLVTNLILFL